MKPTIENPDSPLMTRKEAAEYLRVSYYSLPSLGLDFVQLRRKKWYTKEILDRHIKDSTQQLKTHQGTKSCHENTATLSKEKTAQSGIRTSPSTEKEYVFHH